MDSIKDAEAFHAKVKIHYLGKEFIKTKRAWVLIGIGLLKVIVNTEKKEARLIAKTQNGQQILFNAKLFSEMNCEKRGKTAIIVIAADEKLGIHSYLIETKDAPIALALEKVINLYKNPFEIPNNTEEVKFNNFYTVNLVLPNSNLQDPSQNNVNQTVILVEPFIRKSASNLNDLSRLLLEINRLFKDGRITADQKQAFKCVALNQKLQPEGLIALEVYESSSDVLDFVDTLDILQKKL